MKFRARHASGRDGPGGKSEPAAGRKGRGTTHHAFQKLFRRRIEVPKINSSVRCRSRPDDKTIVRQLPRLRSGHKKMFLEWKVPRLASKFDQLLIARWEKPLRARGNAV